MCVLKYNLYHPNSRGRHRQRVATHCFARTHKDLVLAIQCRRLLETTNKLASCTVSIAKYNFFTRSKTNKLAILAQLLFPVKIIWTPREFWHNLIECFYQHSQNSQNTERTKGQIILQMYLWNLNSWKSMHSAGGFSVYVFGCPVTA